MKTCLLAGSFDPPTIGHLNLIKRGSALCGKLFVGIGDNKEKRGRFSPEEREAMLKEITDSFSNVKIVRITGTVVDFAAKNSVQALLRGLRPFASWEREFEMAYANMALSGIETLFLPASQEAAHISSSLLVEMARAGKRLTGFVPDVIENEVFRRLGS